jgi:hypothetical protein
VKHSLLRIRESINQYLGVASTENLLGGCGYIFKEDQSAHLLILTVVL